MEGGEGDRNKRKRKEMIRTESKEEGNENYKKRGKEVRGSDPQSSQVPPRGTPATELFTTGKEVVI